MSIVNSNDVEKFLQDREVQVRVRQRMLDARARAAVTISVAAALSGFSESQLREMEKRGWVRSLRSESAEEQDTRKHRLYAPGELDCLAMLHELTEQDYTTAEIDQNIDYIRQEAAILSQNLQSFDGEVKPPARSDIAILERQAARLPIDQYIDNADEELFWRFYIHTALRLSLLLLREDIHDTVIGLLLPTAAQVTTSVGTANIEELGPCLIGWLGRNRTFYQFYDVPLFEQHTDFRISPFRAMKNDVIQDDTAEDKTWLVVQRRAPALNISRDVYVTIKRLLIPLYQRKEEWMPLFQRGQRSYSFPAPNLSRGSAYDVVLPKLIELIVSLGRNKGWRFGCILTPHNPRLPVSEHNLVVCAKSAEAPDAYRIGATLVSPLDEVISVSLRAYQGGRICYRHATVPEDQSISHYAAELPIGSAIAVPIGGEEVTPLGVIYLAASRQNAFDESDQRVLRMAARIAQELLQLYQTRSQIGANLTALINTPALADPTFAPFASETDLIDGLEERLRAIYERTDLKAPIQVILEKGTKEQRNAAMRPYYASDDILSFICIDINNQTSLTLKYGERMTRNLSREVGRRIEEVMLSVFPGRLDFKLYQAYNDRYYILLPGIPLDVFQEKAAQEKAWSIKDALDGTYQVDALRFSTDQRPLSETLVQEKITVRLGITSYPSIKLYELMHYRSDAKTHPEGVVTAKIRMDFDRALKRALTEGDIIGWNSVKWEYDLLERP